jgi:hypothetical protein
MTRSWREPRRAPAAGDESARRAGAFTQRLCAVAAGWTSTARTARPRRPHTDHASRYGSAHAHGPGGEPPRRFDLYCSALSRFHAARHSSTDSRLPPTAVLILNSKFRQSFVFRSMLRPAASVASRLPLFLRLFHSLAQLVNKQAALFVWQLLSRPPRAASLVSVHRVQQPRGGAQKRYTGEGPRPQRRNPSCRPLPAAMREGR